MRLVIKLSGKVLQVPGHRKALNRQIERLVAETHQILLVHGGGKQLNALCEALGIPIVQHQGRRVTDQPALEAAKMVFSAINRDLTADLLAAGVRAAGMAAFDAGLVRCRRRPPMVVKVSRADGSAMEESVDFGLIGEITTIDGSFVELLWQAGILPVIACLCAGDDGAIYNINADTLAAELAAGLGAERLISVSDVEGIFVDPSDPSTRLGSISVTEAQRYIEQGVIREGMIPKVEAAVKALNRGVPAVHIVSGLQPDALLLSLTNAAGTVIVKED